MERKIQSDVAVTSPVTVVIKDEKTNAPTTPWYTSASFFDFLKWFFGTLVLGLLGIYTNNQIKETELQVQSRIKEKEVKLQQMEIDSKLVTAVSTKFDKDKKIQLNYLNFIHPFISTESIKVAVRQQIAVLGNELDSRLADSIRKTQPVVIDKAKKDLNEKEREVLRKQATVVPPTELSISSFDSAQTATTLNIQQTKILSTPKIEYNYLLQRPPETKWCKQGYYVEFNNTLRVGINDLKRSGIEINVKRIKGNGDAELIRKEPITLLNGASTQVEDGDYRYKISLDYMGGAGKNPFTQAAYITVASYKR